MLDEQKTSETQRQPGPAAPDAPPEDVMIEIRNIHKSFGETPVLRGMSLSVKKGESAVVLGGSGTGKSVLIRHVVALLEPDAGEVWVAGERVDLLQGDALDRLRIKIGYLFQGGALFDSMTVAENMRFFLDRHTRLTKEEKRDRIMGALEDVNLPETIDRFPAELSGGQKKRVALARAMLLEPQIILYDEPTTGLDPISVRMVSDLIARLRDERGITSVAITHDILCAEMIADSAHFIHDGRFLASGSLDDLKRSSDPVLQEFFYGTDAYMPERPS
jgi:phospholipid/cholesterol/gamma-HCH transport system ATP-binding protein